MSARSLSSYWSSRSIMELLSFRPIRTGNPTKYSKFFHLLGPFLFVWISSHLSASDKEKTLSAESIDAPRRSCGGCASAAPCAQRRAMIACPGESALSRVALCSAAEARMRCRRTLGVDSLAHTKVCDLFLGPK